MSRRPPHFPTTVADCHQAILDLHAELAQLERRAARLRHEMAARRPRSVAGKGAPGADGADPCLSLHAVSPNESDRHNVS